MEPLRVFLGFDGRETLAYAVAAHSIIRRASGPVSIAPVALHQLSSIYARPRGPTESTEFSISRFLVPYLSGYAGYSIFLDCDVLVLCDIWDLMRHVEAWEDEGWDGRDPEPAVYVCKHDYTPKSETKFLGQRQTKYPRKNWSSVIVFNNKLCTRLTPEYVATASGLDLHRFAWLRDEQIHALELEYNWLVGEYAAPSSAAKILHYTLGGPWFDEYKNCDHADLWFAERDHMLGVVGKTT